MALGTNPQSSDGKAATFKTFPEFSKVSWVDRKKYDKHISGLPPIGDIQFAEIMTWWNQLESMSIAVLNDNLVISYWMPGDEAHAGLSLIGTNKVDESICAIFDYLREQGEPARVVNIPQFVINHIQYPELFSCHEDRNQYEYILSVSKYFPLKNLVGHRRRRVERQIRHIGEENIVVRSLDLLTERDQQLLLRAADKWWHKNINNFGKVEREAMEDAILHSDELAIENVCLFINGELSGFCLYQLPQDRRFAIVCNVKAVHRALLRFDLMAYKFAEWFANLGVTQVNINSDAGILPLRMFMLTLGPTDFFRKYRIEPVSPR